ncbi:hypothetical protein DBV15_09031, partial [Temnothorax longispinosus]
SFQPSSCVNTRSPKVIKIFQVVHTWITQDFWQTIVFNYLERQARLDLVDELAILAFLAEYVHPKGVVGGAQATQLVIRFPWLVHHRCRRRRRRRRCHRRRRSHRYRRHRYVASLSLSLSISRESSASLSRSLSFSLSL